MIKLISLIPQYLGLGCLWLLVTRNNVKCTPKNTLLFVVGVVGVYLGGFLLSAL